MENNFYHVEFFWWFLRYIMKKEGGGFSDVLLYIRDIWWGRGSSKGEGGVRGSMPSWSRLQVILRNIVITIHIFILLLNSGVICVVAFPIEISSVLLLSWRCSLPWRHFAHARFPEQPRARGGESTIFSAKVVSMRAAEIRNNWTKSHNSLETKCEYKQPNLWNFHKKNIGILKHPTLLQIDTLWQIHGVLAMRTFRSISAWAARRLRDSMCSSWLLCNLLRVARCTWGEVSGIWLARRNSSRCIKVCTWRDSQQHTPTQTPPPPPPPPPDASHVFKASTFPDQSR